jgi:hypothetical protein
VRIDGKVYSTANPYVLAKANGYAGTEADFGAKLAELLSLRIYDGATGAVDLIAFKIQTDAVREYIATEGMTWGEWVESEYNTDGYTVGADGIVYTAEDAEIMLGDAFVKATDIIVADTTYGHDGG